MLSQLSTDVQCGLCDLHFVDVEARAAHIESSPKHPFCETCCRRFLNESCLVVHLKCAAPHWSQHGEQDELIDGDEVLLAWTSNVDMEALSSYPNVSEDYWSSESDVESSCSTSDSGTELEADREGDHENDRSILRGDTEPGPEYQDFLFEDSVRSSEILDLCPRIPGCYVRRLRPVLGDPGPLPKVSFVPSLATGPECIHCGSMVDEKTARR
ncbi:hypothetical protein B0H11DRAFT_1950943 [Mycena galericulata]|nr:hypothetical protein B0H11DRAFT_1950943 [Mycena galericulata]